jgi:hypothetical protein
MSEQLQGSEDPHSDNVEGACLVIECYPDGEMGFSCDWQDDDTGISCMATILVHIGNKDIGYKVLKTLESMTTDEDQRDQLERLVSFYSALKKISEQNKKVADDDVVIPPLDASTLM